MPTEYSSLAMDSMYHVPLLTVAYINNEKRNTIKTFLVIFELMSYLYKIAGALILMSYLYKIAGALI